MSREIAVNRINFLELAGCRLRRTHWRIETVQRDRPVCVQEGVQGVRGESQEKCPQDQGACCSQYRRAQQISLALLAVVDLLPPQGESRSEVGCKI